MTQEDIVNLLQARGWSLLFYTVDNVKGRNKKEATHSATYRLQKGNSQAEVTEENHEGRIKIWVTGEAGVPTFEGKPLNHFDEFIDSL